MDDWTASATAAAVPPTRAPDCPQPVTLTRPAPSFMDDTRPSFIERGSTVRVRQRALQKRTSALFCSDGLAPGRTCGGYGAVYGAFRFKMLFLVASRDAGARVERLSVWSD